MTTHDSLPHGISEYIQKHFREDFLFEVKKVYLQKGQRRYLVEVSKDNYIHVMTFDEKGQLVNESAEKAFPSERASDAAPEDATPQS